MPSVRNVLQSLAALATLGAIVRGLLWLDPWIEPFFWATCVATTIFYAACYVVPGPMTRLVSMPTAFRVDRNLGVDALAMQSVTYASYHTNWFSNTTHGGFIVDGIAWYVLVWHFIGPLGVGVLLAWQVYQAASYRERVFTIGLTATWGLVAGAAFLALDQLGEGRTVELAMYGLVSMGLWRFVGHIAEPIPPDVAGNKRFAKIKDVELRPRIAVTVVLGYIAEFAAGLPFRLLNFWVYSVLIKVFGFRPQFTIDRGDIESQRDSIHRHGWAGGRSTAYLSGDE